jgi:hypothetical protein
MVEGKKNRGILKPSWAFVETKKVRDWAKYYHAKRCEFDQKNVQNLTIKKVRVWAIVFSSIKVRNWAKKVRDWAPAMSMGDKRTHQACADGERGLPWARAELFSDLKTENFFTLFNLADSLLIILSKVRSSKV